MRPSINIPRKDVIDLDGFFGLHPAMSSFKPIAARTLGHRACCRLADTTRSHFDAQDFMESGTPGVKATEDGWLESYFAFSTDPTDKSAVSRDCHGARLPRILSVVSPAVAIITSTTSVWADVIPIRQFPILLRRCTQVR